MTSKLIDRLVRLEGAREHQNAPSEMPRELAQAWMHAMAIVLGKFPRPELTTPCDGADTFRDGFARALGYAHGNEMDAGCEGDPEDWRERVARASDALYQHYAVNAPADSADRDFVVLCSALEQWSGVKAERLDWPAAASSVSLSRAAALLSAPAPGPGEPR